MGISIDSKNGLVYSCSKDKEFVVSEMSQPHGIQTIASSKHSYTNLTHDKKNNRIFLTNAAAIVYIYTTFDFKYKLLARVSTSARSDIRGLHIDYRKSFIFTAGFDGTISILDLGLVGKERFVKEISTFKGDKHVYILMNR
jgi:hypothetical protein